LYGVIVPASIGKGRVVAVDARDADFTGTRLAEWQFLPLQRLTWPLQDHGMHDNWDSRARKCGSSRTSRRQERPPRLPRRGYQKYPITAVYWMRPSGRYVESLRTNPNSSLTGASLETGSNWSRRQQ
ncbi:MAG TPA: hypothetical protein VGG66_01905, partial [Rhizomicrobium sp.]